jgi:hypothetical protein
MTADQQLPPWMSQQPPAGGMPPQAGMWPGSPPPPPPPQGSPGLLTFVAVVNLIFALTCGCISGFWATIWSGMTDDPAKIAADLEANKDQIRVQISEQLSQKSEKEIPPRVRAFIEQGLDPEVMKEAILAIGNHPASKVIRQTTLFSGLAHAGLLLGSILLLMRKNMGRLLSILALLVIIGANVATVVKFPPIADDVSDRLVTKLESLAGFKELTPTEQQELDKVFDGLPKILEFGVVGSTVVVCAWPVLALLILLMSRGIKDACLRA